MSFYFYDTSEPKKYNQKSFPVLPIEQQTVRFSISFNQNDRENKQVEYSKHYNLEEAKVFLRKIKKAIETELPKQNKLTPKQIVAFIDETILENTSNSLEKDEAFLEKLIESDLTDLKVLVDDKKENTKLRNKAKKEVKKLVKESKTEERIKKLEAELSEARNELFKVTQKANKELKVHELKKESDSLDFKIKNEEDKITKKAIKISEEKNISIRAINLIKSITNF